jgi:hypothetical protein
MSAGEFNDLWKKLERFRPEVSTLLGYTIVTLHIPGERFLKRVSGLTLTDALLSAEIEVG